MTITPAPRTELPRWRKATTEEEKTPRVWYNEWRSREERSSENLFSSSDRLLFFSHQFRGHSSAKLWSKFSLIAKIRYDGQAISYHSHVLSSRQSCIISTHFRAWWHCNPRGISIQRDAKQSPFPCLCPVVLLRVIALTAFMISCTSPGLAESTFHRRRLRGLSMNILTVSSQPRLSFYVPLTTHSDMRTNHWNNTLGQHSETRSPYSDWRLCWRAATSWLVPMTPWPDPLLPSPRLQFLVKLFPLVIKP